MAWLGRVCLFRLEKNVDGAGADSRWWLVLMGAPWLLPSLIWMPVRSASLAVISFPLRISCDGPASVEKQSEQPGPTGAPGSPQSSLVRSRRPGRASLNSRRFVCASLATSSSSLNSFHFRPPVSSPCPHQRRQSPDRYILLALFAMSSPSPRRD